MLYCIQKEREREDTTMKKYDEMTWGIEDKDELVAELMEDKAVGEIRVTKTGEGWLVEWTEG